MGIKERLAKWEEIIEKLESPSRENTEESILLRILVQMMVIVGIIATDIASANPHPFSFWAIPLSIMGAVVSWKRRREKNIAIKFALAFAMILTLLAFMGKLFENLHDTRLVLAEFLIQLQVLHSFDLPRRKDLGYSMVIGLILTGVAATLSQTLAFAPWLFLLLLLGIPTLILDYRSRMGLPPWEKTITAMGEGERKKSGDYWQNTPLSPRRIIASCLAIVTLGLFIFAIMPRYPSYQIQSFPVSAPEGFENLRFQEGANRSIVNPGYNPDGTPRGEITGTTSGGVGGNVGGEKQQGEWELGYYGFNSKINQNLKAFITERKLVLRVRSQAPGFWRVLAFDHYTGQGWEISRENQTIDINRYPWSYQFNLSLPAFEGETKKIIQTYTVVRDLPNIIPSLSYPQFLYFPAAQVAVDTEGSLRSPGGLLEGLTYTVVSQVPYRSQKLLQKAGTDYPDNISKYYLSIDPQLKQRLRVKARELLDKAGRELPSNYDKALYLAQAMKQNYQVRTDFYLKEGEDLVTAFLKQGGGLPDHFATVYTMMLRALDIPARFVVGFDTGQFNPFTGYYLVHNTDAHALTEVYFPRYGWFQFNPLPGYEIIPQSFEDDNPFGVLGIFWKWIAGWLPSPVTSFITIVFQRITDAIVGVLKSSLVVGLWQFVTGSLIGILVGVLGLIALAFLGWLAIDIMRRIWHYRHLSRLQPPERLYREMLEFLGEKGYPKNPAQTPREYSESLREFLTPQQQEIVSLICDSYVKWRYGGITPNVDYLYSQYQLLKRSLSRLLPSSSVSSK
ncbi:MAG: DUF3488 and DUF4129 domain-containing transglutaminase family protein [Geminocystis sp.]|nr:DUF3488 and DUF4129 domain-containing transglutaminase family protein [Geminocystis sp.]MDW8116818.1 DUF3488 and DUF4129 domain-containing transglutaminase family protein [Geminocystis sp.]